MKITTNYSQPSFKMAVKATQEAKEFLRKNLNGRQLNKFNKIIERQKSNPHDILIATATQAGAYGNTQKYLHVIGSNKEFYSGDFFTPLFTIRRAEKYVDKFKKMSFDDVFKKMNDI